MATTKISGLMKHKDESGNLYALYPVTTVENVEGLMDMLNANGVPKVSAASTDGVAYTGTVDGITELTAGLTVLFIPAKTSTSTNPTFNLNNLGAKNIKRRLSSMSSTTAAGMSNNWLFLNKPQLLMYDGSVWIVVNQSKPVADDLYSSVPVSKGGTGLTTMAAGSYLVGNGDEDVVLKTPAEVLDDIGAAPSYDCGTTDLTAGSSTLASGKLYFVYE